jgi:hypothetical protein
MKKYLLILVLFICLAGFSGCAKNNSIGQISKDNNAIKTNNDVESTTTDKTKLSFFDKYYLYYTDRGHNLFKNDQKIDQGGEGFGPEIIYSDGSFVSDKPFNPGETAESLNYELFFQGNTYKSDIINPLRYNNFIYYTKCVEIKYNSTDESNGCSRVELYSNNDKVDEGYLMSDLEASFGGANNIELLFVKNGILYYNKTLDYKDMGTYSYDPVGKKISLYKPELFNNNENRLLAILDNGDIIFSNSKGIFKNNNQSMIMSMDQLGGSAMGGIGTGNNYYYFNYKYKQTHDGHSLFKNDLLVSKINSNVYGRIINSDYEDCHFHNYYHRLYATEPMYCISKKGVIIHLDKEPGSDDTNTEDKYDYIIDNNIIDFSAYFLKKDIISISFIFNDDGDVYGMVASFRGKAGGFYSDIYFIPYLGDGKIQEPQLLKSGVDFVGVVKK